MKVYVNQSACQTLTGKSKTASFIYTVLRRQVEEVYMNAQKYKPAVLQNESHPYLQEKDLRNFCQIHNIVFQVIIFKSK